MELLADHGRLGWLEGSGQTPAMETRPIQDGQGIPWVQDRHAADNQAGERPARMGRISATVYGPTGSDWSRGGFASWTAFRTT